MQLPQNIAGLAHGFAVCSTACQLYDTSRLLLRREALTVLCVSSTQQESI